MKYAFVLGKNRDISIAELGSFFGEDIKIDNNANLAFTDKDLPAEPQRFLDALGGSLAIIKIIIAGIEFREVGMETETYLKNQCGGNAGKCNFAINALPQLKSSNALKFLLVNTKKNLRKSGMKPNFMNNNFNNVSDVFAVKQRLVEKRTWLAVIQQTENKAALGVYVASQDFENYSKRDYGKPFRDPEAGMLPPKLAQTMINLTISQTPAIRNSSLKISNFIYDPFCGSATILMEAMLAGHSVVGSDNNAKMADGSAKNLAWLKANFDINDKISYKIFHKDATKVTKEDVGESRFCIATEPLLGPPLSDFPSEQFLGKIIGELSALYLDFFENLASWFPAGAPIVIVFPYWRDKKTNKHTMLSNKLIDKIQSLGYIKTDFAPLNKTSLFYDRPDQVTGREIVRFVKK